MPNLLATFRGRLTAFFFLYVTEGIPLGFGTVAVATQLRRQGVGPAEIGAFVGLFYLPWAFKWLAGPFIDTLTWERVGRRRFWILLTQFGMIATLLACLGLDMPRQLGLFTAILFIHNSFGAAQDVAIDALAVGVLQEHERGVANGVMFAGAAMGQALGGAGGLYIMSWAGFNAGLLLVAGCISAVTLFIAWPLREGVTAALSSTGAGIAAALGRIRSFSVETFRSFVSTRGAFAGLAVALLPAGAMSLGLALQQNLAVEIGMDDNAIASLAVWSQVIAAAGMVVGGLLSDRLGRRRTLFIYLAMMSPPVLYLMTVLGDHDWIMPVAQSDLVKRTAAPALVTALWIATCWYSVAQGLMYGTRSAIFMDVTNPLVAASQFTAYMALCNLAIAYSATWQGIAIEAFGYPRTLLIDAITGLLCLALIPLLRRSDTPEGDGRGPVRARALAGLLGIGCLAWLPYRLHMVDFGAANPIIEILFSVVFCASFAFLGAGAAVLGVTRNRWALAGLVLAPLILAVELRKWFPSADWFYLPLPALAAVVLLAQALQPWRSLGLASPSSEPVAA
ncbi:MFS transporter [soil metagenome]